MPSEPSLHRRNHEPRVCLCDPAEYCIVMVRRAPPHRPKAPLFPATTARRNPLYIRDPSGYAQRERPCGADCGYEKYVYVLQHRHYSPRSVLVPNGQICDYIYVEYHPDRQREIIYEGSRRDRDLRLLGDCPAESEQRSNERRGDQADAKRVKGECESGMQGEQMLAVQ